eukprot:m.9800 g.9800  ORF g.9800 m.9800 type:complete len:270 (+) comp7002_c0_seq1:74-883(+)
MALHENAGCILNLKIVPNVQQTSYDVWFSAACVSVLVCAAQMGWANWTQWQPAAFVPGNLTAAAYRVDPGAHAGTLPAATDASITPGTAVALSLSLDAPNPQTGTGNGLLLDGQDAALVRVSVLDSKGRLVSGPNGGTHNVTFRVVSGPGRVVGVGNGDPSCHEPNRAQWRTTYHGLARAIVQTTVNAVTPDRSRQKEIDVEHGTVSSILDANDESLFGAMGGLNGIVVEASAPGFPPTHVTIPVSVDADTDHVLAVASDYSGGVPHIL